MRRTAALLLVAASCAPTSQRVETVRSTTTTMRRDAAPEVTDTQVGDLLEQAAVWDEAHRRWHAEQRAARSQVRSGLDPRPTAHTGEGLASWYARGARTANGDAFNPDGFTTAHRTLPFGTKVRVCRGDRCVDVRVTDRGPAAWTGRELDLSRAAFAAIAPLSAGVVLVRWEVLA